MAVRYAPGTSDERQWGRWEVLATGDRYCVKRITVKPGMRLSFQRHRHRREHWTVVEGRARVRLEDDHIELGPDGHLFIPLGARHRIENISDVDLVFIEVQTGDELDEEDIERLEDDFGRS
jgi:mannose-6-phosphate isomerase-like protein (cupin superfamily)